MTNYSIAGVKDEDDRDFDLVHATHPAQPGTFMVYAHKDGTHTMDPVILWGVQRDTSVVPITFDGAWGGVSNSNVFVLHPSGHCSSFERSWADLAPAVTEMGALEP
jgi:hypothetical protein